MGTIYKRGKVYWIQYYRNGKPYRETTKSKKETDAKRLLKKREGEISEGKLPGIYFDRVKFDELSEDFLRDYRINQRKSLDRAERSTGHLKRYFEGYRVPDITSPKIEDYIETRLKEKENNTRKGFFEHADFIALRNALPSYLKGFATFGYRTGWRFSEIAGLTWSQVDLDNSIVRLEVGETKNDAARTVYLDDELQEVFQKQWECRGAWQTACKNAGIGQKLFHDFRRTAIRNMVRAGIPEGVAMKISGHKTRSVFDRYNIVNDADLQLAAQKQAVYLQTQKDTVSSTVHDFSTKKEAVHDR